jgi:hypothetical protein
MPRRHNAFAVSFAHHQALRCARLRGNELGLVLPWIIRAGSLRDGKLAWATLPTLPRTAVLPLSAPARGVRCLALTSGGGGGQWRHRTAPLPPPRYSALARGLADRLFVITWRDRRVTL